MDSALAIFVSILHHSVKSINMYILFQNNGFPTAQMRVDCFVPITTVKCYIRLKSYQRKLTTIYKEIILTRYKV